LSLGQLDHTGRSPKFQRKAAAFVRWHEPDDARVSRGALRGCAMASRPWSASTAPHGRPSRGGSVFKIPQARPCRAKIPHESGNNQPVRQRPNVGQTYRAELPPDGYHLAGNLSKGGGAMVKSNANQPTATASEKSTVVHVNFGASSGAAERLAAGPHDDIDQIVNRLREEMSWSPEAIPPPTEALKPGASGRIVADSVEEEFME
jgi:hypothetical protein